MRAAICSAYGPPEIVRIEDLEPPRLRPGQVRIAVEAAAANYPDVLLVAGEYQIRVPPPFTVGSEAAGRIIEVGDGVGTVRVGDRVRHTGLVGAFAEELVVAANACTPVAEGVSSEVAAAAGVAQRTSYHALRSVAGLRAGEEVVVLGAGGGVGLAAVQIAAILGARVTAVTSSAAKRAAVTSAGATTVIDRGEADLRGALRDALPDGADVVLDPVGGDLAEPALRALRPGGRFVTVGYAAGAIPRIPLNLVLLKGIAILGFEFLGFAAREPEALARGDAELEAWLAAGTLVPVIGARFPLAETPAALRALADGAVPGKIVIDVV
ncbi:MAG: NADPH:quinone oxidoreductase family protein [Actinomycetota bacterium]